MEKQQITITSPILDRQELGRRVENLSSSPEFKEITSNMEKEKTQLEKCLSEIGASFDPIVEDEHMWGLFKTNNYRDSIVAVYDRLKKISSNALDAIKNTNSNLRSTLGLITLLARTEKDIYQLIDNSELKMQDITDIIQEICNKNNIKDDKVKDILEQQFKHSYTLRDRINGLRLHLDKRLDIIDKHFAEIQQEYVKKELTLNRIVEKGKHETLESVNKEIDRCTSLLNREIDKNRQEVERYRTIAQKEREELDLLKESLRKELLESINKEIDRCTSLLNREIDKNRQEVKRYRTIAQKERDELNLLKESLRKELLERIETQNNKIVSLKERCHILEQKTIWEKAGMNAAAFILGLMGFIGALISIIISLNPQCSFNF